MKFEIHGLGSGLKYYQISPYNLQAIVKSPLAGDFMTTQCRQFLEDSCGIDIVPSYQIASE